MRLGLFELLRKKESAKDWVWIMDHTVQLGPHKCLVIVGVRLSAWRRKKAPLEHEDLSLLSLVPMEQSTAAAVARELEATRQKMGVAPVAVLSDEGAYHCHAAKELKRRLFPLVRTPGGARFQAGIVTFVREQSRGIKKGRHVLGSSEVLESLLGKYKRIQGTHSKGGMTGSLLNIGAAAFRKTSDTIQKALGAVPVAVVGQWVRDNLGLTIPAQQALALHGNKYCPKNQVLTT
jgi:hypothetical protein